MLLRKISIPSKTKDIPVKLFSTKIRINETKTFVKHISCECKYQFNMVICNSNQKWNNKKCQYEYKNYGTCTKNYSWNPSTCISENDKYLKGFADTSEIVRNKVIYTTDTVLTNVTNTISTNVTSTVSINDSKKVRCKMHNYILHTVLLVIILLAIIAIICYLYAKFTSKIQDIL